MDIPGFSFRVKCQVDAIQWGGGVVAEFSRRLRKPTRFSGGGGSARNFPLMGPFYIFFFPKEGGPGPPGPPWIGHCIPGNKYFI